MNEMKACSRKKNANFFYFLILFACIFEFCYSTNINACEQGSCLPGTGNLLIGREKRLKASSTCGTKQKEFYCIFTNSEEKKKCFRCDSSPRYRDNTNFSHIIEYVVPTASSSNRKQSWWQSENGIENVTIQLDLEAEFYFTYLFMKFKTFRPAAALVERSYDYGQTWKVYRYFAYDCAKIFPWVPREPQNNLSVAFCDEHYSSVTPTTGGEVILRILPSTLQHIDPYSNEIQNLVKITNLRINFTKLHTLGDDLLDSRAAIQNKYYYAISDMVVGGSCSCYGHANRCVPQGGVEVKPSMVHGQCECTHNTKGLNCEKCEDFFNDLEWQPAIGKNTHACRKCNCNNHAISCHFDKSVFDMTGRVSGGVCDDCQHNTMGRNCEQCKHFYYQDPLKDFSDPEVCLPCDCDPSGSLDEGICDSRTDAANDLDSGRCHCKLNVEGRRCDTCKNGYWNFTSTNPLGCQTCSCHIHGTYGNQGCNKDTGVCYCKRHVIGRDCNQCLQQHWGLSESPEGCSPCACDIGGSYDNNCDIINGQCKCRQHLTGRQCNLPTQSYFTRPLDFMVYEAETANCSGNCKLDIRQPHHDIQEVTWTGHGFVSVDDASTLIFDVNNVGRTMEYDPVIRHEPQNHIERVRMTLDRLNGTDKNGKCGDEKYVDDIRETIVSTGSSVSIVEPYCLEAGKHYRIKVEFIRGDQNRESPSASIIVDSMVLVPRIENVPFMNIAENRLVQYENERCRESIYSVVKNSESETCKALHYSISAYVYEGAYPCKCDTTGSYSTFCNATGGHCQCKPNVVGRQCDRCAPGTYGFGPEGCKACDCHSVGALDNFCDVYTGQCKCQLQTYGRVCDQCQPGSWNYPNCQRCICHGHADVCNQNTGACLDCKNSTGGDHCNRCIDGYYGDPRIGVDIPCRKCPCPGTIDSGHSYAQRCSLEPRTQDVVCECGEGYSGSRCDVCSDNYFGDPEVVGGRCSPCNCSNNVDVSRTGNCDPHTGQCLQCLFNTEGSHCEMCKSGFFGNATQQLCAECVCDFLGTDEKQGKCDRVTGQCPCLPNVVGVMCDQCAVNHWKIASGLGCEPCACDPIGSESEQCNQFDGQCWCKPGFGGRQCDQCQTNFWGNPNVECYPCDCNPEGSASMQCHQNNGSCICVLGIGGKKCDECARGFLGQAPRCNPCGECFNNWDMTLNDLKDRTSRVVDTTAEIMKTGATGSYAKEFEKMEKVVADMRQLLQNSTTSSHQLEELEKFMNRIKSDFPPVDSTNNASKQAENITQRITISVLALNDLKIKATVLNDTANDLKNNATKLQEDNIEGALNLTKEMFDRSQRTQVNNGATENLVTEAERQCKRTESLMGRSNEPFIQGLQGNNDDLRKLDEYMMELEARIPNLNLQVCDKGGNPCDTLCGGAGCGFCGGISCENGSVTKVDNALKFAKDAEKIIYEKEMKVGEQYRNTMQSKSEAKTSFDLAQKAYNQAQLTKNKSELALNKTSLTLRNLDDFLKSSGAIPLSIKNISSETIKKNIKLQPEQITDLAHRINDTVSKLTNIDAIIRNTENDLKKALNLKNQAEATKTDAESTLNVVEKVVIASNDAETSQILADLAIQTANENISLARTDLAKISNESAGAQGKLDEASKKLTALQDRYKRLHTEFLKNNVDTNKVAEELKMVTNEVDETRQKMIGLQSSYKETGENLNRHASNSSEARNNVQLLLDRASQLAANTTAKLAELGDSEGLFNVQDKTLMDLKNEIDNLINRMQSNFDKIKTKSEFYKTCLNN